MIRTYIYRSPRLHASFPIEFQAEANLFTGLCLDLSSEGLRAHMQQELVSGTEGWLTIEVAGRRERVLAVVANFNGEEAGFAFRSGNAEQIDGLRAWISDLAKHLEPEE